MHASQPWLYASIRHNLLFPVCQKNLLHTFQFAGISYYPMEVRKTNSLDFIDGYQHSYLLRRLMTCRMEPGVHTIFGT
jgi:hypothetical protein